MRTAHLTSLRSMRGRMSATTGQSRTSASEQYSLTSARPAYYSAIITFHIRQPPLLHLAGRL